MEDSSHDPTMSDSSIQTNTEKVEKNPKNTQKNSKKSKKKIKNLTPKRERPARACTVRSAARLHAQALAEAEVKVNANRKRKNGNKRVKNERKFVREPTPEVEKEPQCKIVTKLVGEPNEGQEERWKLRGMWELASVLNFLNVFRPILNIKVEFSVEELETALITPNSTLADLHIPLLKAIPPVARMALGRNTWITVLCRKLRDWWYWVAEGELPISALHGAEFDSYIALDPGVRVIILKAICDIRVEQEDIRNYIDNSIKHGIHLSTFRKERIGGDSYGISYWYEDDPIIGHRLYREIRKVDVKKTKGKNAQPLPSSPSQWETIATNLDDFLDVSEKLCSSENRTEASLGKKLKSDILPQIEIVHKRKEKLLKKQQREALLLDNMVHMDGFGPGRSLRDRKPVTYTFDDYDRSISEAIKINKNRPPSPNSITGRENAAPADSSEDAYMNGQVNSPPQNPQEPSFDLPSPMSSNFDEVDEDSKDEIADRSNRRRQRSQRYLAKEYIDAMSDNDEEDEDDDTDSDFNDEIAGEAEPDEEYTRQRKKKRKMSSSSEGDEEYNWDDENPDDEDEEEEEEEEDDDDDDDDDNPSSMSEDSDEPRKTKKLQGRPSKRTKSRSISKRKSGVRRSSRATRNRINYKKYETSDSEAESENSEKWNSSSEQTETEHEIFSEGSQDPEDEKENEGTEMVDQPLEEIPEMTEEKVVQNEAPEKSNCSGQDEFEGMGERRFLDLNELAPGSGFDDGPDTDMKDEDTDDL